MTGRRKDAYFLRRKATEPRTLPAWEICDRGTGEVVETFESEREARDWLHQPLGD